MSEGYLNFHKFIKKTLRKLHTPMHPSEPILTESSSNIFERQIESNSTGAILTNPETPQHYSLDDYTSPILDHTAEMLNNPKVDFKNIKLNCYCDDSDSEAIPNSTSTNPQDLFDSSDLRPRSRSIISLSLMSSLEDERKRSCVSKHNSSSSGAASPLNKRLISRTNTRTAVENHNDNSNPGDNNNKSGNNSTEDEDEDQEQTIEYYSYADMVNHEDYDSAMPTGSESKPPPPTTRPNSRKGSCYTISLKDYIGVL